jgi:hypothetical protein
VSCHRPVDAGQAEPHSRGLMSRVRRRLRFWVPGLALPTAAAFAVSPADALAATNHPFAGSYIGRGEGVVAGTIAAGSASGTGHASAIGAGSFHGSAHGTVTSETCATFAGRALLKGTSGTLTVSASGGRACVDAAAESNAAFSGHATVTGGTGTAAGAHGTVTFKGSYNGKTGTVTLSFKGTISY